MPAAPVDAEVVVVGLGPVGLLACVLLGRLGLRVVGLDAAAGPAATPRAATVDDEVLRILQGAGLDGALLAAAQPQPAVSYVTAGGHRIQALRTERGRLGQPPLVGFHQPALERALVAAAGGLDGVELRWGTRVDGVDPAAGAVAVAGAGSVRGRWVLGCDGARSTVRGAAGVAFTGSTFAEPWLVVDVCVAQPVRRVPHVCFVGDPRRPLVSLPLGPGRHRWEWMLRAGEDPTPLLAPDALAARLAPWLDGQDAEVERAVVYTYHARRAARWRAGRVLLAGDAAHVMPPFAGQGLSSGVRDVANLAWKLDAVRRGAPDALLDSYEAERAPHVAAMTQLALRWGAVVQTTRPRAVRGRDAVMRALDGSRAQRLLSDHAKPLPTYRAGAFARRPHPVAPLRGVGALFPQPEVGLDGRRVRLDDALGPGWAAIVDVARPGGAACAERLRTAPAALAVHRLARGPAALADLDAEVGAWLDRHRASWVLLRPDRFVFACGGPGALGPALAALAPILPA